MGRALKPEINVVKGAAGMGLAAAVSRAFGAARVLVVAAVLGTTHLGDTFQSTNTFSTLMYELLAAGALSAVLVPTFQNALVDDPSGRQLERLARGVTGAAMLALTPLVLLGMVTSPHVAAVLTSAVGDVPDAAERRELTATLLVMFLPQVLLYAAGAVATAVLHAKRRYVAPAAAPIGNTVVMVSLLLVFRWMAGPHPGLRLSVAEQLVLGAAGTLGVAAFVATPVVVARMEGISVAPLLRPDRKVLGLMQLSGWATLQHAAAAAAMLAAVVFGGAVEGGVVALQVGWVFLQAPYGILTQPVSTAALNELVDAWRGGDREAYARVLRWALETTTVISVGTSAIALVFAEPAMGVLGFGSVADDASVRLLAAGVASMLAGLLPYSGFLMLARASYVLGDSRTPAILAACGSMIAVVVMAATAAVGSSHERVFAIGVAHGIAYLAAGVALAARFRREHGTTPIRMRTFGSALAAAVAASGVSGRIFDLLDPTGRVPVAAALVVSGIAFVAVYASLLVTLGFRTSLSPRHLEARVE